MRIFACVLLIAMLTGCGENQEPVKSDDFVNWLKKQGETNIVVDASGVGLPKNETRLRASVHGMKETVTDCTVEVEFKIILPSGGPIIEYVSGSGDTKEKAISQAVDNFLVTTMHVIYKAYLNSADESLFVDSVHINGQVREMIAGRMVQFSPPSVASIDLVSISQQIEHLVTAMPLSSGTHWIKAFYSQAGNKPILVAATLDNKDAAYLIDGMKNLKWPQDGHFYMVKQFIIIK